MYVPRKRRIVQSEPVPTFRIPEAKVKTKFVETTAKPEEVEEIHKEYHGGQIKHNRNTTYFLNEDWSWNEDTYYKRFNPDKMLPEDIQREISKREKIEREKQEALELELPTKRKNFNENCAEKMSKRDIRIWRSDNDVRIIAKSKIPTPPLINWDFPIPHPIIAYLQELGFESPTTIQAQTIPMVLDGYDIIGLSKPGTGKTLAYVIPILCHVLNVLRDNPTINPIAVVMVPTHDLAIQINNVVESIGKTVGVTSRAITAHLDFNEQMIHIGSHSNIVIATPGRLAEVAADRYLTLAEVSFVAIDEADKMADESLGPQMDALLSQMAPSKRLVMFSATMADEALNVVAAYFSDVVRVAVGAVGDASENVRQVIKFVDAGSRLQILLETLKGMQPPILVFTNTRQSAERVADEVSQRFRCAMIHGGRTPKDRDAVVNAIRDRTVDVVVATDVLARGIDIEAVPNVVNYELPETIRQYVHRIGRTGRGDAKGVASSLMTKDDKAIMYDLRLMLERGHFAVPEEMARMKESKTRYVPSQRDFVLDSF